MLCNGSAVAMPGPVSGPPMQPKLIGKPRWFSCKYGTWITKGGHAPPGPRTPLTPYGGWTVAKTQLMFDRMIMFALNGLDIPVKS